MSMYPIAIYRVINNNEEPTFSNIPQNFDHLQIRVLSRCPASSVGLVAGFNSNFDAPYFRFNGDATAANYVTHNMYADGATITTNSNIQTVTAAITGVMPVNSLTANAYGISVVDILDYSKTNKFKTIKTIAGSDVNGSGIMTIRSGMWMSTAAISSIFVGGTAAGHAAGSIITIYGITTSNVTGA